MIEDLISCAITALPAAAALVVAAYASVRARRLEQRVRNLERAINAARVPMYVRAGAELAVDPDPVAPAVQLPEPPPKAILLRSKGKRDRLLMLGEIDP